MQIWQKGSTPPPGEYEYTAFSGGRLRVWVGDGIVIVNGEPQPFEQVFNIGRLTGPIEDE